ncbi:MAG: mannose-6-phosphate isomerase-like protein (cupin superfamily) [Roseivirga sp.]|jgi:mannose-6-phosphate isomerase-like protein (cupin superfamily)
MKSLLVILGLCMAGSLGFYLGMDYAKPDLKSIDTQVFTTAKAAKTVDVWGRMGVFTPDETITFGTSLMFTAVIDVLPGQEVHPPHRHLEEELLFITRGSGVWSINGKEQVANAQDLLYAQPWDTHGLLNTGSDTLTFFVAKWKSKSTEELPTPK